MYLATIATVAIGTGVGASPALASTRAPGHQPAWRITAEGLPTDVSAGGTGEFLVNVENIGNEASAASSPVTVVDRLPAGLVATQAGGGLWACAISFAGRTVTCTYQAGVTIPPVSATPGGTGLVGTGSPDSLPPAIPIEVNVEPSAVGALRDVATVSGGGALAEATGAASVNTSPFPAPFGIASFDQWSTNVDGTPATQAGSHPYETVTSFVINTTRAQGGSFQPSGVLRNIDVNLPGGFIGDPNAVPKCPREDFDKRHQNPNDPVPFCAPDTQIGVAIVALEPGFFGEAPVYNLVPPADVPAQFGIAVAKFVAFLDASVRPTPSGSYSVAVDTHDTQTEGVSSVTVSLWGVPAAPSHNKLRLFLGEDEPHPGNNIPSDVAPKPFLRLPTSCGAPQTLMVSAVSWKDPLTMVSPPTAFSSDEQGNPVTVDGCSKLDFSPSLSVTPESTATSSPTGLDVALRLPQNEDPNGLGEADFKSAVVTMPQGLTLSSSAANGLQACSREQIGVSGEGASLQFNEQQPTCPAASKVGTVEVCTPLLENEPNHEGVKHEGQQACEEESGVAPLKGAIYVASQETVEHSLIGAYLVLEGHGLLVKLQAKVELGGEAGVTGLQPGQIRASVQDGLQAPFNEVKLHFFGGAKAPLMTPATCGSGAASSVMAGWNGSVVTPSSNAIATTGGCTQSFAPSLTAGSTNDAAGQYSPFALGVNRSDSDDQLSGLSFVLPAGIAAKLAGVPECPDAQASVGACPESTQIGTVTVGAGPGPEPLYVKGTIYLTGPYKGAPFGEVVEVPAIAGPFDLDENGRPVVVRGAIRINPSTAQGEVISDPLPTELRGIQIDERSVQVDVNRPNFMLNPTNCGQLATIGAITSTKGTRAAVSSPFKASGCSKLPFKPAFSIATGPKATKQNGASLTVKLKQKPGEANIHKVNLQFPALLPSRLSTLQRACTEQQFAKNPSGCPKGSVIGTAKAVTPVLSVPLTGPAILVSHGAASFPDVEFVLQGKGVTIVLDGKTDIKKGVTYSRFETVPDAPVTSFEARFPTGPYSIFAAYIKRSTTANLCGTALQIPTTLVGQNGAEVRQSTKVGVTGCPKAKHAKHKKKAAHKARTATAGAWRFAGLSTPLATFVQRGIDSTRRAQS